MELYGGCFCGAVRYRVKGEPVLQLLCYCRDCLTFSGTDGYAGMMFKAEHFQCIQGTPRSFAKTSRENRTVVRHFCSTCGTGLWGKTEFGLVSIPAGTLDEPERFDPQRTVFTEDAPHWARIAKLTDPASADP